MNKRKFCLGKPLYIYRVALALILVSGLVLSQLNSVSHASESIFNAPTSNPSVGSGWSSNDRNEHQSDMNSAVDSANDYTDSKLAGIQDELKKIMESASNNNIGLEIKKAVFGLQPNGVYTCPNPSPTKCVGITSRFSDGSICEYVCVTYL